MPHILILLYLYFSPFLLLAAEKSDEPTGLSDSFGSFDEEYITAKNKAIEGGEIVGDREFTDRDRKINSARRQYGEGTARFKKAVKEITARDFFHRSKNIVDKKISQAVQDSLRQRILVELREKMDGSGFFTIFSSRFPTFDEEVFRTEFDRQVQYILYEWVGRYKSVSELITTIEQNQTFLNSEIQEKSLRVAVEGLSKNRVKHFFYSGEALSSVGQVEEINVGYTKIVRQANSVLGSLPDRRFSYRETEQNRLTQEKAKKERESKVKRKKDEAEATRLKALTKEERVKEQRQKKQEEKEKQAREKAVWAEQRRIKAIRDKEARAETWRNVKSGAANVAVKTGKCVGMLCVAPVAIPAYLAYKAGVGLATSWSEYQADAPNRERRRQEEKAAQEERDRKNAEDKQLESDQKAREAQYKRDQKIAYAKAAPERARQERERQDRLKEQRQAEARVQVEKSRALRAARWTAIKSRTATAAIGTGKCIGYLCAVATSPVWVPALGVGYAGYRIGAGAYHAGASAASSWSEYQAAAPERARAREREKERQANENAKRKEEKKAQKIAKAEERKSSVELVAERQRTKKERKQAWQAFQSELIETEQGGEKRAWMISTLGTLRKKELINLAVEKEKLEQIWSTYQKILQRIQEEKEALEAQTEEKSELGEQLRQHQLRCVVKWLAEPKELLERRLSWEDVDRHLRSIAHNTTITYNRKFLFSKKPKGIRITNGVEENIWRTLQADKKQQENLTSISFVDDITSVFEKKKTELRRAIKIKEIVGISRKAKETSSESSGKSVAPIVPFALSTDVLATDDNFRLIEEGPTYLRVLLGEAGKEVDEISAMLAQGLWEVFLQMRKKGSAPSPELALKAWNVMEERKKKRKTVDNTADISLAYIDRLQVLADDGITAEKTVREEGVVFDKVGISGNGPTVRTRAETEKRFSQNTYHPFPETLSYAFDPSVACAICGNEQRFVVRSLQDVAMKERADGKRKIQIPLPGTHKLSTCGHMICTSCLEAHRKEKLRKVDPYECPQCNAPIPYWELDSKKWTHHFGLDYGRVAHEEKRSFQDLRMEELQQMYEDFRSRLVGRLAGNGLELEGSFYRKIRRQVILPVEEQRKWIAQWEEKHPKEVFSYHSKPFLPLNPEVATDEESERYNKYMEEIQADFPKYEETKEALHKSYQEKIVALAWEMQKPSVQNREVRRHLNQYEFVFPEEKVTTKAAYARFSFHRDSAAAKFMRQVDKGIQSVRMNSREDFLVQMRVPHVADIFSAVNEGFTEIVDNQLLVFNGSEAYRDFAYEALGGYAKEEQYPVKDVIEKSDLSTITAGHAVELSKEKEHILASLTGKVETAAQQLEKAYSQLNWHNEAEETAYVAQVEETKKNFTQLLDQSKQYFAEKVVRYHFLSYLTYSIDFLYQHSREEIRNFRPADTKYWQTFNEWSSLFKKKVDTLLSVAQKNLEPTSFTDEVITLRIDAMESAYQLALTAFTSQMEPIVSRERNAAEFQQAETNFYRFQEENWRFFVHMPASRSSREEVFTSFQNNLNREINEQVKTRNLSLDVLQTALKRQKICAKKIEVLQKWKSLLVEKEVDYIRTDLQNLAQVFLLNRVLSHPSELVRQLELMSLAYQKTYVQMTESTHCRDQTAESYAQAYEQLVGSLNKIAIDAAEALFSPVLAQKSSVFSIWSRTMGDKQIKELLGYITHGDGERTMTPRVGAGILSFIGWYILDLDADSKATQELVGLYQDTYEKMKSFLGELIYEVPVLWNQSEKTGLHNFGATCYLNTIYQSFATDSLYPLLSPYRTLGGESNGRELRQNRTLQKAIYRVVNALRSGASVEALTPMLEATNAVVWQTFSHVDQGHILDPAVDDQVPEHLRHRDAEEFLRYILAAIKGDERTGVTPYRVRKNAQTEEMHVEPQRDLILPLALVGGSISDILRQTHQAETADGEDGKPTHYFWGGFSTLPSTLVISLKRFGLDNYGLRSKNTSSVHIPPEIEVAAQPVDSAGQSSRHGFSKKYRLVGSYLHHVGEDITAGHYTFVKLDKKGNWIEHDDTQIVSRSSKQEQASFQTYVEQNAYVVIYEEVK